MLKDLRLLKSSQKLRVSTALLAADGRTKLTGISEKLERWREHFSHVSDIHSEVTEQALEDVPVAPLATAAAVDNEDMSMVPSEEEIRDAIGQLRSGRASGEDMISAELLKLGEEVVECGTVKLFPLTG